MLIVFTTTPNIEEAESLAKKIVEAELAACVQVLPQIQSFYIWDGQLQNDSEQLLLIKTLPEKYTILENFIKGNHSYEVPEIVAITAERVSDDYRNWIFESLKVKV